MTTELIKHLRECDNISLKGVMRHKAADALEAMQRELDAAKELRNNCTLVPTDKLKMLQTELDAAKAEIEQCDRLRELQHDSFSKQLAARDLVIQQMREALEFWQEQFGYQQSDREFGKALDLTDEALSLQPTTEHLDAYVAEKVKDEREACAMVCDYRYADFLEPEVKEIAAAIRARSDKASDDPALPFEILLDRERISVVWNGENWTAEIGDEAFNEWRGGNNPPFGIGATPREAAMACLAAAKPADGSGFAAINNTLEK